jgi:hypothetical protein
MIYLSQRLSTVPSNLRYFTISAMLCAKSEDTPVIIFNPEEYKAQYAPAISSFYNTIFLLLSDPSFTLNNFYIEISSNLLNEPTILIIENPEFCSQREFETIFLDFVKNYLGKFPAGSVITKNEVKFGYNIKTDGLEKFED